MENLWQQLSSEISEKIARAGGSVVAVDGRSGHTSSGLVWRPDHVLTASHTVRADDACRVITTGGKSVVARIVGRAHASDIALLKLDEPVGNTAIDFGDSSTLAVGTLVAAVARTRRGNVVASFGILGGLMGEWRSGRARIDQFIRADLTLYPGFSGGALINGSGKILGMMTAGLMPRRAMAIPGSTLNRIAEELLARGHAASPYVGLVMQPVSIPENLQKSSGVSASGGLLVMHVEPSGPAEAAGVLLGDILVSLDGELFEAVEDMQDVLFRRGIHQDVPAVLIRAGNKIELTLKIGERRLR